MSVTDFLAGKELKKAGVDLVELSLMKTTVAELIALSTFDELVAAHTLVVLNSPPVAAGKFFCLLQLVTRFPVAVVVAERYKLKEWVNFDKWHSQY